MPQVTLGATTRAPHRDPQLPETRPDATRKTLTDRKTFLANQLTQLHPSTPGAQECAVCTESASDPVQLPCSGNHIYCKICIGKWLQQQNTCPLCREVLFTQNQFRFDGFEFQGMHYTVDGPPPPYEHPMYAMRFVDARMLADSVQWEGDLLMAAIQEEMNEMECDAGYLGWAAETWGGMVGGVALLLHSFQGRERADN